MEQRGRAKGTCSRTTANRTLILIPADHITVFPIVDQVGPGLCPVQALLKTPRPDRRFAN
jgi:hypothetical protein